MLIDILEWLGGSDGKESACNVGDLGCEAMKGYYVLSICDPQFFQDYAISL